MPSLVGSEMCIRDSLIIYAGVNGFLDPYPVDVLQKCERELYKFIEEKHPEIFKEIDEKKELDDELDGKIRGALEEFKEVFVP